MNDEVENNSPDRRQNNLMTQVLATLVQTIGNIQSAPAQGSRKQNIAQVPKFNGYENEDLAKWVKRFDAACLTNN